MDAKRAVLEEKLADSLKQASKLAAELQALDQGTATPHFDDIELPAHEVGQRLSRMIQSSRVRDVAADKLGDAPCPDCRQACRIETRDREVHSIDGLIEITETVAYCRRCRRSFFPSA